MAPSVESAAGGVGVGLQIFKNKVYKKHLLYNVNRGIIKANKETPSTAKEVKEIDVLGQVKGSSGLSRR